MKTSFFHSANLVALSTVVICIFCIDISTVAQTSSLSKKALESVSTQPSVSLLPMRKVDQFSLAGIDAEPVDLVEKPSENLTVICFLAVECPLSKLYAERLNSLAKQYVSRGVRFLAVDSNDQDSMEDMREFSERAKLQFAFAKDDQQRIARDFGATRNPEVFLLDEQRRVLYQGRIDDQYQPGIVRNAPTTHDLKDTLDLLLAGKQPKFIKTQAAGCLITFRKLISTDLTYNKDIKRVLKDNCVECHRAGEIGPFALTDYDEVLGWGEMMVEVVDQHRMPPWNADDSVAFANARKMPERDKQQLREWVAGGMPLGDENDLQPAEHEMIEPSFAERADLVLPMAIQPFPVPATGTIEYQYFVVDPKFTEDRWVTRAEVIPGSRAVVHHCIVFVRPPDEEGFELSGLMAAYVPGQETYTLPEGLAQRIPAGCQLVFQMHYTPNGVPQEDLTKVALQFTEEDKVTDIVYTVAGVQHEFEIPPNDAAYKVDGKVRSFPRDGKALSLAPHMHFRGKSFEVTALMNSDRKVLLKVPHYDFNWQHSYVFQDPIPLKDIDQINFVSTFDNSKSNPSNPAPDEYVTWGDQTWEEMSLVFMTVSRPYNKSTSVQERVPAKKKIKSQVAKPIAEQEHEALQLAQQRLQQFDRDGDALVSKSEVPRSFLIYQFGHIDIDGDGFLSLNEIEKHALLRSKIR